MFNIVTDRPITSLPTPPFQLNPNPDQNPWTADTISNYPYDFVYTNSNFLIPIPYRTEILRFCVRTLGMELTTHPSMAISKFFILHNNNIIQSVSGLNVPLHHFSKKYRNIPFQFNYITGTYIKYSDSTSSALTWPPPAPLPWDINLPISPTNPLPAPIYVQHKDIESPPRKQYLIAVPQVIATYYEHLFPYLYSDNFITPKIVLALEYSVLQLLPEDRDPTIIQANAALVQQLQQPDHSVTPEPKPLSKREQNAWKRNWRPNY